MTRNTSNMLTPANTEHFKGSLKQFAGLAPEACGQRLRESVGLNTLAETKAAFLGDPGIVVSISSATQLNDFVVDVGAAGWLVVDASGTDYRARVHKTLAGAAAQVSAIVSTQSRGEVAMADLTAQNAPAFTFYGESPLGSRTVIIRNFAA